MRKVISLRLLVCLVGTLVLAATAVIGASLTDSAVTEKSATADGKLDARSTEASLGEARPPVNIDPLTASADDDAASTVGDSGETSTLDSAMGGGPIDGNITPIDAGVLDGAATVARYGPDPDLTMVNTETGDATGLAPIATDASQVGVTSDSGGAGGDGVPSMGSATGLPLAGGPETSGGDTGSAAPVPELATFVLVVFPVLAALIVRLRG